MTNIKNRKLPKSKPDSAKSVLAVLGASDMAFKVSRGEGDSESFTVPDKEEPSPAAEVQAPAETGMDAVSLRTAEERRVPEEVVAKVAAELPPIWDGYARLSLLYKQTEGEGRKGQAIYVDERLAKKLSIININGQKVPLKHKVNALIALLLAQNKEKLEAARQAELAELDLLR